MTENENANMHETEHKNEKNKAEQQQTQTARELRPAYGGQAVIEGVMMKAPDGRMAVACRLSNGEIVVEKKLQPSALQRYPVLRLPILRGVTAFGESLFSGMEILNFSAQLASRDFEGEEELSAVQMALATGLALVLGVGLFIVLPTVVFRLLPLAAWTNGSVVVQNLLEGALRLLIFLSYVLLVSNMKDIRRVFEYHGAEHKTIHCYESGQDLTVDNAQKFTTLHPRCGTSFLLIVMVVGSLFFSLFGWPDVVTRVLYRLALLPVVAGVSYEVLRFMGRFQGRSAAVDVLIRPGLELQRLTTREPDAAQLEVAIAALNALLIEEPS